MNIEEITFSTISGGPTGALIKGFGSGNADISITAEDGAEELALYIVAAIDFYRFAKGVQKNGEELKERLNESEDCLEKAYAVIGQLMVERVGRES